MDLSLKFADDEVEVVYLFAEKSDFLAFQYNLALKSFLLFDQGYIDELQLSKVLV